MVCFAPQPVYADEAYKGINKAASRGDGYSVDIYWYQAVPDRQYYFIAFNIYYSSVQEDVFSEGVKYIVTDANALTSCIYGLRPGDTYYFAVRATEFETDSVNLAALPSDDHNNKTYPEAQLLYNITSSALTIPVQDPDLFPPFGIVQVGAELIGYSSLDLVTSSLVLNNLAQRGLYGTEPRFHNTDGYDGYRNYDNPLVRFFKGFEECNEAIDLAINKFTNQYARTNADGYKEITSDILTTNLGAAEISQRDFMRFDYAGYRRTSPADLLAGKCVGSYYGGQYYCADSTTGVGMQIRGISFTDSNDQRQEMLLETTGRPVVLLRRMWTGKTSQHYDSIRENTAYRGLDNYGTHMVTGYNQFFNPRRADGRIMVRFAPSKDDLIREDAGLESKMIYDCWTMAYPPIKDSDYIIRFDEDNNEEFRYEVIDVTRNDTVLLQTGMQKFTAVRARKTDPIYQFRTIRDTSTIPTDIVTGLGGVAGSGGIALHLHHLTVNENITVLEQISQTTGITLSHNHAVIAGEVQISIGHQHPLTFP